MKSDPSQSQKFSPENLAILACPKCKGHLHHNTSANSLDCTTCKLRYPIRSGIPVLLQESAEPL